MILNDVLGARTGQKLDPHIWDLWVVSDLALVPRLACTTLHES